ncbi:MAC/Perforin domain [Carpediemonas membranifera]|uniref:MAC/Perforin domain n=1 Tax=Carpediemonas membranifera TaxID=201153 RepID=A0A8J6AY02_9EUKA|nr:MAC/Perforin domain [Carpediemonas membranifera]|eukprot:KAG9390019.1 MAC/Perforin domain [Carpediemonas membranifera]
MKLFLLVTLIALCFAQQVPGADYLSAGFDGLKLEGGLSPIFSWRFTKGKTFTPQIGEGKLTYDVPDYVAAYDFVESGEVVSASIYQSFESYFKEVTAGFSLSVGVSISTQMSLSVGANVEWGKIHQQMKAEDKTMAYSNHWYTFYKLTALPAIILHKDDMFTTMQEVLPFPVTNADDQDLYNQMVLSFGTHYYARLHLGAYVHFDTFIDQTISKSKDQSWLKAQASLTFHYAMWDIAFKPSYSRQSIHIDNLFKMNANSHSFFQGGNPAYQSNSTLKQWEASLAQYPAVVNVTLQPQWFVMKGGSVRDHLAATIKYYLKHGKVPTNPVTGYRTNVRGPYDALLDMPREELEKLVETYGEDLFVPSGDDMFLAGL